jgi:hypothetical protein
VGAALLGLFGFVIGGEQGIEAIERGNTAQGFFRLALAVFSGISAVKTITGILKTPGLSVRSPLDVAAQTDYPEPPGANNGASSIGNSPAQNQSLAGDLRLARFLGAEDIRVNQQQVNANGVRVGINRPDLQFTLKMFSLKLRVYIEYDPVNGTRAAGHQSRISSNDPWSLIILKSF